MVGIVDCAQVAAQWVDDVTLSSVIRGSKGSKVSKFTSFGDLKFGSISDRLVLIG
jgi:hypothetical protein